MRTLYDESFSELNISSEQELAQFTVTGQSISLITLINISNLSGDGGQYYPKLYIDDHLVVPDRSVTIVPGVVSASFQSRNVAVYENGVLKVTIIGGNNDTNVQCRLLVLDVSPVTVEEMAELVNGITPTIVNTVEESISGINITVKPETKVVGPCKRPVVALNIRRDCN